MWLNLGKLKDFFTKISKAALNGSLSNRWKEPRSLPSSWAALPIVRTSDSIPSACLPATVWG